MITTLNLGQPHPVLAPAARWQEPGEDAAAMWAEFARVRLTDGPGRLAAEALETLAVLGRPSTEYFALFTDHAGQQRAALVAGGRSEAVLAYRADARVELSTVQRESLPAVLMRQLPDAPAARTESLNVRTEQLASDSDQPGELDWPRPGGNGRRDAAALLRLTGHRIVGQGELYAGVRDHHGRYQVTRPPLYYQDLDRLGRVLLVHTPGYLSVLGASEATLVAHLRQARRELTAA